MITHCVASCLIVSSLLGGALLPSRAWGSSAHDSARSSEKQSSAASVHQFPPQARQAGRATSLRQAHKKYTLRRRLGRFRMTAYTQYASPPRRTASGTIPTAGRTVSVDPKVIPLGSVVEIEGIGTRIAEDTGGTIKGKKLDLYLPSIQACRQFGARSHEVYLLE